MYQVSNIKASIAESQGLYSEPKGIETNGQWVRASEDNFGPLFVAAHNGEIFKAEMSTYQTYIDEIFPDPTWLTVAVVDRSYIRMSNKGDMRHIEDLVDDETLQAGLEGDEIAVFYQGPQGWYRSQGLEDAADKLISRDGVVIFISDTACSDLTWENCLKDYRAWADGYLWDISRAVDVQPGEHVTHFTISEEAIDLIEWERVTGSVIFTPDSDGWNEPNIPVQQLI